MVERVGRNDFAAVVDDSVAVTAVGTAVKDALPFDALVQISARRRTSKTARAAIDSIRVQIDVAREDGVRARRVAGGAPVRRTVLDERTGFRRCIRLRR